MKLKGWLVAATAAASVAYFARGGCVNSSEPDEQLADHFEEVCSIAAKNIDTPVKGVKKLGGYMVRHLDDMLGDFGGTIATIESIKDDAKHDKRAYVARERMSRPWISCIDSWMEFWTAVDQDPEATELSNRAFERLNRTFEIIFGDGGGGKFDIRRMPTAFTRRLP
jgi:hypothetical protein